MATKSKSKKPKRKRPPGSGKRGPLKGKGGRPPKLVVDDALIRQVEAMAGLGLTLEQIGLILGISESTVEDYKRKNEELSKAYQRGRSQGAMEATQNLRDQSRAGNVAATIFYLKTQCRWREPQQVEITGKDGGPVEMSWVEIMKASKPDDKTK